MTSNRRPLLPKKIDEAAAAEAFRAADSIRSLPGSFEANAIDALDRMMLFSRVMFDTEAGHLILRIYFRALIGAGKISTTQVIAAARDGDRDADRSLREVAAEMLDRGVLPPTLLRAYVQSVLLQPKAAGKQGQKLGGKWARDLIIAGLVGTATRSWDVLPTRYRDGKNPSQRTASYLVAKALGRHGINLDERSVENIYFAKMKDAEALEQLSTSLGPYLKWTAIP